MTKLNLTNEDIGQKVYEIEQEITLVIKTHLFKLRYLSKTHVIN